MTKIYKVRHKATGLYYSPGQGYNLSKEGKIYTKKNTILNTLVGGYTTSLKVNEKIKKEYKDILKTLPQDQYGYITTASLSRVRRLNLSSLKLNTKK